MDKYLNKIMQGDCLEVMKGFEAESIDLVVTSPPYDNMRDYKGYSFNFEGIAKELFRVIKKGGVVVWVVGDETINFCESLTEARQKLFFVEQCGFKLLDTMIYQKRNYAPAYPSIKRYAGVFEYMLILSKGIPLRFNPIQVERREQKVHLGNYLKSNGKLESGNAYITRKSDKKIKTTKDATNVWLYSVGGGKRIHPAPYPEGLAKDHILSWSNEGDIVLDPMNGSGTTTKMAKKLGRNYIGIEISPEYCKIANQRLAQEVLL